MTAIQSAVHTKYGDQLHPRTPDFVGRSQESQRIVERRRAGALTHRARPMSEAQEELLADLVILLAAQNGYLDDDDTQPVPVITRKQVRDYAPLPRRLDRTAPMATRTGSHRDVTPKPPAITPDTDQEDSWPVENIVLVVIGVLALLFFIKGWIS